MSVPSSLPILDALHDIAGYLAERKSLRTTLTDILRTLEQRYDVAKCLLQGKVYAEIRKETGESSATVSRVNRMLNYGTGAVSASVRFDLDQGAAAEQPKAE